MNLCVLRCVPPGVNARVEPSHWTLSACAIHREFVNHLVNVFALSAPCPPCGEVFQQNMLWSVTLTSVRELVHEIDNWWQVPPVRGMVRVKEIPFSVRLHFVHWKKRMPPGATLARSLLHTPGSTSPLFIRLCAPTRAHIGDPINKKGFEVSINF